MNKKKVTLALFLLLLGFASIDAQEDQEQLVKKEYKEMIDKAQSEQKSKEWIDSLVTELARSKEKEKTL